MAKYYALIGPKLDGPALNSAMTACSIEPSIRQVPRLYVNRMGRRVHPKPVVGESQGNSAKSLYFMFCPLYLDMSMNTMYL